MMTNLMTILERKAFISSNPRIVLSSCPPPCGHFSIQESASGSLSYKVKKTDSLSTASLMCVEIQHEFVYPLEDAFVLYLPDYFNNSLFVIQGEHPLSDYSVSYISIIVEISRLISIIVEIVPPAAGIPLQCDTIICIRIQTGR